MADQWLRAVGQEILLYVEIRDDETPGNNPVTGETPWAAIRRASDDQFWDFTNGVWKVQTFANIILGDTDCQQALADQGDGVYEAANWDQGANDAGAERTYYVTYVVEAPSTYEGMDTDTWQFDTDYATEGDGITTVTITVQTAGLVPIPGAEVAVWDVPETSLWYRRSTGVTGILTPGLDITDPHHVVVAAPALFTFAGSPYTLAIGATTLTCTGVAFSPVVAGPPNLCVVFGTVRDGNGVLVTLATDVVRAWPQNPPLVDDDNITYTATPVTADTDGSGVFLMPLPYSSEAVHKADVTTPQPGRWYIEVPDAKSDKLIFTIPDAANIAWDALLQTGEMA